MPRRAVLNVRQRHQRWLTEIKRRGFADVEIPQLDTVELMEWAYRSAQKVYVARLKATQAVREVSQQFQRS